MSLLVKIALTSARRLQIKDIVAKGFCNPRRDTGACRASRFDRDLDLDEWFVERYQVLTVKCSASSRRHVVFLHGGAYVAEAMSFHRRLIEKLVKEYGLKVSFIDYPLTPENTAETTHRILMKAYLEIAEKNPGDEFCLFGDSAGGGLALAFLQQLRDQETKPFPVRTVLASPWLDVTMSNVKIKDFEEIDPMLSVDGLIEAGNWYAGALDPRNPLVSPIYGSMSNLGSILLLVGTHEVFNPDCSRLKSMLEKSKGSAVEFILGQDMMHDWILAPFRETKPVIDRIAAFCLQ